MQISKRHNGNLLVLLVEGRIDVHWSEHLASAVREEMRQGSHHVRLDLSRVPYLSSAGIGALVRLYHEFKSIQGSFAVTNCSPTALKSLEITNLARLLVAALRPAETGQHPGASPQSPTGVAKQYERDGVAYEIYPLDQDAALHCRTLGDPLSLGPGGSGRAYCQAMEIQEGTFAIGLGALGEDFADCRERYGEMIAAGGAVAYLPTDQTSVPDFLLAGGATPPEAQVFYAIACESLGPEPFKKLIRFEATGGEAAVKLSVLLDACLEAAETDEAGLVMIAESAGLVGAALRRAPQLADAGSDLFRFPAVRQWLSFTAETAYSKSVALLAGIALRRPGKELENWVRPLGSRATPLYGHVHAAPLSYRPVPKGKIDLKEAVRALFEGQSLEGILHLLSDDRSETVRESEFVRGACWIAPIAKVSRREERG
jgi:anti-anti-sigma factor